MKEQIPEQEHRKIKRDYREGKIRIPAPVWHWKKSKIDFEKQGDIINQDLFSEGYSIIEVKLENLISKFDATQARMYRLKKLYNGKQEERKISQIVKNWINGQALIPPIILLRPPIGIDYLDTDKDVLMPQDGKHRINVAYCYGCDTIPIIVMDKQKDELNRILGIN